MSLLMEALKKAEQAKRKAAEGGDAASAATPITPVPSPPPASGLTLELAPTEPVPKKVEPVHAAEPTPVMPPPDEPKYTPIADRVAPVAEPEKPAQPDIKAVSAPVVTPASAPPKPVVAAPAPMAPTATTPAAKPQARPDTAPSQNKAAPRALVWPAVGVVAFLLMGSGGYWYYTSMSAFLQQQTTRGVPLTVLQPAAPEEITAESAPVPVVADASKPAAAAKSNAARTSRKTDAVAKVTPPPQATPVPVELPAVAATPQPISVSRNVDQTEIFSLLQQAYRHYQNNDDARAQVLYARVLDHEEHNRDALLGLAAIAVRQRDTLKAQEIYNELLALDPRDTVAQAGFVGVTRSLDPLQQEARVKQLLETEPNSPHLLFTYATLLMQQQRWSEASRTLLSALQSQRDNPDYAFNLAVTLDHQGQNDSALRYYRMALDQTSQRAASFRVEDVRRRIATLETPREGNTP